MGSEKTVRCREIDLADAAFEAAPTERMSRAAIMLQSSAIAADIATLAQRARDARTSPGTTMGRTDDTDPSIERLARGARLDMSTGSGEPALPPAPYDPPETSDAELNHLLSRLNPPRAPRPIDLPTTDGDLAARYHAGARPLPVGTKTPAPEANVQLACTAEIPFVGASRSQAVPTARRDAPLRDPRREAQTVEIPIVPRTRRGPRIVAAAILGVSFVIGATAVTLSFLRADPPSTATTAPPVVVRVPPAASTNSGHEPTLPTATSPTSLPVVVSSAAVEPSDAPPVPLPAKKSPHDSRPAATALPASTAVGVTAQPTAPSPAARVSNPMIVAPL
jgi:hypothetical protein